MGWRGVVQHAGFVLGTLRYDTPEVGGVTEEIEMEVTGEFIARLRRELNDEMYNDVEGAIRVEVLAAFDRAALAVVLNESAPAENPFSVRARKAAATRARHKREKQQDTTKEVRDASAASSQ